MQNGWLMAAGGLNLTAALLHLACIVGGAPWYRALGAGEEMAQMAERGMARPGLITLGIALILMLWAWIAFSAGGLGPRLPLVRPLLIAITGVYLLRALALPAMLAFLPGRSTQFLVWSSLIVLIIGLVHAMGLWTSRPI